jgi:hypothetical protein
MVERILDRFRKCEADRGVRRQRRTSLPPLRGLRLGVPRLLVRRPAVSLGLGR